MAAKFADSTVVAKIRKLASTPERVEVGSQAKSDMLAWHLTKCDVCDTIVAWIDAGERVKPTILHSYRGHQGKMAFEITPRMKGMLFYIKVTFLEAADDSNEDLLLLSVHPSH